uniref:Amino acid transporter transmembrane domain-containing protein n=1 Tax=Noctiluca scintillans TaxID=2966 RepID=A0A7S1EVF6_NOCSC|mmetsp:Transcript_10700/g.29748  ORF Transcript_10700/g.29748 Transcript_10700/m.29748 type:complete len:519 (+) Transcript_10700:50-1606(+)
MLLEAVDPAALERGPNAEDETIKDLRRAILSQCDISDTNREAKTPPELRRPDSDLLHPDIGRMSDLAKPGGFRREHVRIQKIDEGKELDSTSYVFTVLADLMTPQIGLPSISHFEDEVLRRDSSMSDAHGSGAYNSSSNASTALVIAKCFVGSAAFITPQGFKSAGALAGPGSLLLIFFFMMYGMLRLIECREVVGRRCTYNELGFVFGSWGPPAIQFGVSLCQFGFTCIWMLMSATDIINMVPSWGLAPRLFIFFPIFAPLCLIRQLKLLTVTNFLGIVVVIGIAIYMLGFAFAKIARDGVQQVPVLNTQNMDSLLWLGTCGYIFEGINLVLPIYEAAKDKETMPKLLFWVTFIIVVSYMTFGTVFYIAFGTETKSMAMLNLPVGSVAGTVIPVLFSLVAIATVPLDMIPIYQMYERRIKSWSKNPTVKHVQQDVCRLLLLLFGFVCTYAGGQRLQGVLALVGGLFGANLALSVPCAIHLKLVKPTGWQWAFNWFLIVWGVVMGVLSTYQVVSTWND